MKRINHSKFKMITITFSIAIIFSLILSGCPADKIKNTDSLTLTPTLQQTLSPEPAQTSTPSAISRMNTGSSKKLTGKCLFVNIFLSDSESSFNTEDKQLVLNDLEDIFIYFQKQAEKYDKTFTPIYGESNIMIDFHSDSIIPTGLNENWEPAIMQEIYQRYNLKDILDSYNADNISFIYHINKTGICHARPKQNGHDPLYSYEIATVFRTEVLPELADQNYIVKTGTSTLAHEILHLFGAIDLYYPYNPEDERIAEARALFPRDIMHTNTTIVEASTMYDVDVYLIGWTNELYKNFYIFLE